MLSFDGAALARTLQTSSLAVQVARIGSHLPELVGASREDLRVTGIGRYLLQAVEEFNCEGQLEVSHTSSSPFWLSTHHQTSLSSSVIKCKCMTSLWELYHERLRLSLRIQSWGHSSKLRDPSSPGKRSGLSSSTERWRDLQSINREPGKWLHCLKCS